MAETKQLVKGVIFDIDGTLSPVVSWLELTTALGASADRHRQIFDDFRANRISYEESRAQLIGLWHATGRATRQNIAAIFNDWPFDPFADQLVADLKSHGVVVGMITGSFDLYAQIVARRLGVDHWYANTRLVFSDDGVLISYDYVRDQPTKKLESFQQFLLETKLAATDCAAIGDGPNDMELFRATGRGVFIDHMLGTEDVSTVRASAWQSVPDLLAAGEVLQEYLPSP